MPQNWFGELIPLVCTLFALIFGILSFYGKRVALYFKLITMGIGCYALGNVYDIVKYITDGDVSSGFNVGYFGAIGCFLFLLSANYGQMDGVIDDRSKGAKKARVIGLAAPLMILAILLVNYLLPDTSMSTKIIYTVVAVFASLSSYFNLKHAAIPDMRFGFIKAIRPYNLLAALFAVFEMMYLTMWNIGSPRGIVMSASFLGAIAIMMTVSAKKGVQRWKI